VREAVESDSEYPNINPLADFTLGLQYEPEWLGRYTALRDKARLPATPFQHTLIVSTDPWRRTLDALFWAFETDPHAFRLSTHWNGERFTYVITNGIFAKQGASNAVRLASGLSLGRPNLRRCTINVLVRGSNAQGEKYRDEVRSQQKRAGDEVSARRLDLLRRAVDHVERHSDDSVRQLLSRLAQFNPYDDHRLTTAVFNHLATLYAGATGTGAADEFVALVAPILDTARDDSLAADSPEDSVPDAGWDYWLGKYRECLDALRASFGLPGHFFRGDQRIVSSAIPCAE